jgi:hypothetical protein
VFVSAAPSLSFKFDYRDSAGGGILDRHITDLLGVHGAKEDIVHAGSGPIYYINFIFGSKPNYLLAMRNRFHVRPIKRYFGVSIASVNPVF